MSPAWRHLVRLHRTPSVLCCRRSVATWSPLGVAFNARPEKKLNFNINRENVGLFQIPQLKDYTGFYLLQQNAQNEAESLVKEVTNPDRQRNLVQVFDQLSDCLCRVADMADFIRAAHPDDRYCKAAEDACVSISILVEKLNTNVDIYNALREVLDNGEKFPMDAIDKRVSELFMFDFEQSGIHLPEDKRKEFVKLNEDIMMLGTYFSQGCQRPTGIEKSNLPAHLQYVFALDGDNVMVTGMFSDHDSELVREAAYRVYLHTDKHQEELLEALLRKRDKLARLVGFPSYAHRALRATLGDSAEKVMDFLVTLAERVRPLAAEDFDEIKAMKSKYASRSKNVMPWDTIYYTGLARHERCQVSNADLAPYLSLGSCMEGLSVLFKRIFGISLEYQQPQYGELWSYDVHKLAVEHETEGTLGYIYCDFFERPGKPHQDCHFTIRGGRVLDDGSYQVPIVVLMLNMPPPRGNTPSLLTPGMVENLFHEFGHAMHSMLGRTRYQHVTGTRCPTDFAEVPSVLMEYFATDPRVLSTFARHWQTGQVLPEDIMVSMCKAKRMFSASETQMQVFYSILDQVFHGPHPLEKSLQEILADVQNRYYTLPHVPGTAWHLRFGHFFGYGAKYYSYLMSKAVASRIWQQCFKENPFNRDMGERLRHKMLAHGGGRHPAQLVQAMLGEEATTENLTNALIEELHND